MVAQGKWVREHDGGLCWGSMIAMFRDCETEEAKPLVMTYRVGTNGFEVGSNKGCAGRTGRLGWTERFREVQGGIGRFKEELVTV